MLVLVYAEFDAVLKLDDKFVQSGPGGVIAPAPAHVRDGWEVRVPIIIGDVTRCSYRRRTDDPTVVSAPDNGQGNVGDNGFSIVLLAVIPERLDIRVIGSVACVHGHDFSFTCHTVVSAEVRLRNLYRLPDCSYGVMPAFPVIHFNSILRPCRRLPELCCPRPPACE